MKEGKVVFRQASEVMCRRTPQEARHDKRGDEWLSRFAVDNLLMYWACRREEEAGVQQLR